MTKVRRFSYFLCSGGRRVLLSRSSEVCLRFSSSLPVVFSVLRRRAARRVNLFWSRSKAHVVDLGGSRCGQASRGSSVVSSKGSPPPSVWLVAVVGLGLFSEVRSRAFCSGLKFRVLFSTGGLWWIVWRLLRLGLDFPLDCLRWRRYVVSFGAPLQSMSCRWCGAHRPCLSSMCFLQVLLL
ncbi:hypothetical protein DY000_02063741 [Brassica cretica]|uniref:Transmembrane protein n=1 Tax=Brassica cretica TaxID=69181 RepID=A0ABQ7ARQ5_BRACR|nr:hypothetical protein DY000_02063741 [Brassica cretica]